MAKKPKRKFARRKRYIRGNVDELLTLGTLAGVTLVGTQFDEVVEERTLVSSIDVVLSMTGFTKATDDGPIQVGIAHSDYSDAEIEEVIESTGSWTEGDKIEQEKAKRLIRTIGIFDNPASASESVSLHDGVKLLIKLNWILTTGQTLRLWAYNLGSSAIGTTSPVVRCQGHANLWPR